jgi:phage gp46-like protein
MKDLLLYETGSGGDFKVLSNDLALTSNLSQIAYLCLFGGNVEQITTDQILPNEERSDWWGNSLFFKDKKTKMFNSLTEKTLKEVVLNSRGRMQVIQAVKEDLSVLSSIANIFVDVAFDAKKIIIFVKLTKPETQEEKNLKAIWDTFRNEVIIDQTI